MEEHHRRTIERLSKHSEGDPRFLALIIGGSVAKGRERSDSDIDFVLVATDDEFERRKATRDYFYLAKDLADYEGGYVDGKVVDLRFLRDAADHGSEPARWAFTGAFVAFSHLPGIERLIESIPVYQEQDREEKISAFVGQVRVLSWYVGEAEKRQDRYLLARTTTDMAFYACRLILAHNRVLYPYHKWLMYEVERAPDKPPEFVEIVNRLLAEPCTRHAEALRDCVVGFRDWGVSYEEGINRFMEYSEWNWRHGRPPLQDW